jgi:hypothetical protein
MTPVHSNELTVDIRAEAASLPSIFIPPNEQIMQRKGERRAPAILYAQQGDTKWVAQQTLRQYLQMQDLDPDNLPLDDSGPSGLESSPPLPKPEPTFLEAEAPPGVAAQAASQPSSAHQSAASEAQPTRDRVVVLGRTQAGKTVFVARLYEQLWNSRSGEVHMRALSGPPHVKFMQMISSMRDGRWPDATGGKDFVDVEVTFAKRKFRMTLLDYPGETFSKAFVMGQTDASDTVDLVEHIDRAAGVIMLIDPQNAVESRDQAKRADDDFGMQQVLHRIRSFPDGDRVPVAIVLTKTDLRNQIVKSLGGLEQFARVYLSNLIRPAGEASKLFRCVAVWSRISSRSGKAVPDMDREPLNLVNPLIWVLKKIVEIELMTAQKVQSAARTNQLDEVAQEALRLAEDTSRSLDQRIMNASAKVAAASALGGEHHPAIAQTKEILSHLREHVERRSERNFWLILGLSLATVAVGAIWLTLRLVANESGPR